MSKLINLDQFGFTPKDIEVTISYLFMDKKINKDLIQKYLKLARYIKK